MRLAIFGGTFDPPHVAHLIHAQHAAEFLQCDIVFVPAGVPPHKPDSLRAAVNHRVAMVEAAIADNPAFHLSRIDIDRPGPHYTVDTLRLLGTQYPGAELFLLIGADSLRDFPTWHRPNDILPLCKLAVFPRPTVDLSMAALEASFPGLTERVLWIDLPLLSISSTEIVLRLEQFHSARYLVPEFVLAYIEAHRLYGYSHTT